MITLHYAANLRAGIFQTRMPMLFATGDQGAHEIRVTVTEDGQPVSLAGRTVSGYFIRADRSTVLLSGSAEGNTARVTLSQSCYVQPGGFSLFIKTGVAGETAAVFWGVGTVVRSTTDTIVDPSETIPSLDELLALIGQMETEIEAAQSATSAANTAAQSADAKAAAAQSAAGAANTAAGQAATAAGNASTAAGAANTAAQTANTAAQKIDGMTVSATGLTAGSSPTAVISDVDGHKHVAFGIPAGQTGPQGDTGATPEITIGTVTTGAPGTDASATMTGPPEAPVLSLTIPRGMPGEGNVSSVAGVMPDEDGDVPLSAENVGARPVDWLPDGLIYPTTAQALEAMSQEQQAALYAQGYRAIKTENNGTVVLLGLASDGSLEWLGCNQPRGNLLDNPDFGVAQAGYGGNHGTQVYAADRFILYQSTLSSGKPENIVVASESSGADMHQRFFPSPGPITIGFFDADGNVDLVLAEVPEILGDGPELIASSSKTQVYVSEKAIQVNYLIPQGGSQSFSRMFCYSGSYTAKTLPPWVAPDPVAELIKCQKFFRTLTAYGIIGVAIVDSASSVLGIVFGDNMRIDNPSLVGEIKFWSSAVTINITSVTQFQFTGNGFRFTATTSGGVSVGEVGFLIPVPNDAAISADL